jgi:hypothetical protein
MQRTKSATGSSALTATKKYTGALNQGEAGYGMGMALGSKNTASGGSLFAAVTGTGDGKKVGSKRRITPISVSSAVSGQQFVLGLGDHTDSQAVGGAEQSFSMGPPSMMQRTKSKVGSMIGGGAGDDSMHGQIMGGEESHSQMGGGSLFEKLNNQTKMRRVNSMGGL